MTRRVNHNWSQILRILNDCDENFVCSEHDPPDKQRKSFQAQEVVEKIAHDPKLMGEVYMRGKQAAAPPGTPLNLPSDPLQRFVEVRRRVRKRILLEALRFREREKKRAQRQPPILRLDSPLEREEGSLSLHEAVPDPRDDIGRLMEAEEQSPSLDLDKMFELLKPRERQVAELLWEGYPKGAIAERLGLSPRHVRRLVGQLRCKCKIEPPG